MEILSFKTLKIGVIDESFPEEVLHRIPIITDIMWKFDIVFRFKPITEELTELDFEVQYKMYRRDDPHQKTLLFIRTESRFEVEGKLSINGKTTIFYKLASVAMLNCQGIYASRVEGTKYDTLIPPRSQSRKIS